MNSSEPCRECEPTWSSQQCDCLCHADDELSDTDEKICAVADNPDSPLRPRCNVQ